jgi:glucose/mannose transport system substrate-binding protein
MRGSRPLALMGFAAATLMAIAFGSRAVAQEKRAEVIHFLTATSESAAIGEFAKAFKERGGTWVDSAVAGGSTAKTLAINRITGGTPPAAAMFNLGPEFAELAQNGLLRNLDDIAEANDWRGKLPQALVDAAQLDGHFYVVPTALNGQNFIWYNKALLAATGAAEPKTWQELFGVMDKVKAAGKIPFAVAGQKNWVTQIFWAVLLAEGGRDVYLRVMTKHDEAAVRSPEFRKAVETFVRLAGYIDPGSSGRNWNDTANLVITGKAAFMQMGTWARGEFNAAGQKPDVDYGCTILGLDQGYQLQGGVFFYPKLSDPAAADAQKLLIETMSDPAVQAKFASHNGSVPFWKGADRSGLDACVAKSAQWATAPGVGVGSQGVLMSPQLNGDFSDLVSDLWNAPTTPVDRFVQNFAAALSNNN